MNDQMKAEDIQNRQPEDGLIFACILDGRGGGALAGWREVENANPDVPLWIHSDRASERVQQWLRYQSGLTPITVEALLAEETRPRSFRGKRGTIAILRSINSNDGERPDDMVAIRIWSDGNRLITIRHDRVHTPKDLLVELVIDENGPETISAVFERLISRLTDKISGVVHGFEERLDQIEAELETADPVDTRAALGQLRREAVVVRRYMAPQREAIALIYQEPPNWLDETSRLRMRETANRLMQFIEAIDEARERAIVLDDGIANRMAETMNRNMYILSIVAAIFLPLGFITGLLGINVGGMPGVDDAMAFWITCAGIAVLLGVELIIFRRLKWI